MGGKGGGPVTSREIDILVEDRTGKPTLVVECKSATATREAEEQLADFSRAAGKVPFAMLVGPHQILVFRVEEGRLVLATSLDTLAVFAQYEPRFGESRVYEHTLVTLSGAWLRDLMDHWRGTPPPGEVELDRIGLLPLIVGGWTRLGVASGAASLR